MHKYLGTTTQYQQFTTIVMSLHNNNQA